jgi:hypothetical protein
MKIDPEELCWLNYNSEMRIWAESWELVKGDRGHGLGDLTREECTARPGLTCPACGKVWV